MALLVTVVSVSSGSRAAFLDTTDNTGNSFDALNCFKPAQPSSVQSGTTMSDSNGTVSIAITPVDPAMSFLVFSSRHSSNRPVGSVIRGRLSAAGDAAEFVRVTNEAVPVPMTIEWYVVEYSCGIRVQRGEVSQISTSIDVPIIPVGSTGQAFVLWSKTPSSGDGAWDQNDPLVGELTAPDNLQFRVNSANSAHVIAWQVIEFIDPLDVSVQRGTTSLPGTNISTTVTLGSPVDVSKTFILVDIRSAGSGVDIGSRMVRAELTNSTTITIDRAISGTPDDITEITWQAIELKDGSSVQRGSESFLAGAASSVVGISTIDTARAYAFGSVQGGSGQNMGQSPYAGDDIVGVGSFTATLTANNLTLTRDNTAASADVGWFVVYWDAPPSVSGLSPSSGPGLGGTSVVISGSAFTGATAVDFGANPATGFTVDSDSQITATSPAGVGTVDVQVTTALGTSSNTGADDYTFGTTYYVRTDGADTNPGLSNTPGGAWLTVQKAASTMVAGDAVRVQSGTYPETVTPLNGGTAAEPITYLAEGVVVIEGGNVRCKAFDLVGTGYVIIDGFEITNQPDCGGADSAVDINNSNNVTVRNNIIHDTGRDGVYFGGTSANGLVENNLIYNIDDDGSTPVGAGSHTYRNNTFAGTFGGWTLENGLASNLFEDNIFWGGSIQDTSLGTFNYNDYNGGALPGTGNFSSNPLFVNAATFDFHLSHIASGQGSDSPAIDTGSDTATNQGLDTRTTRTDNVTDIGTVDLGFHYDPAVAPPSVSGLSPSSGPGLGGTSVVISGSAFTGATAVDFGATPATGFTVDSDSQITATSPAGVGTVDVQVTTASGTSSNTGADDFTFTSVELANAWTTGLTHTAGSGSDRLLVFMAGIENDGDRDLTSVSYGGQAMIQANESVFCSAGGFCARNEVWYLSDAGIQAAVGTTFTVTLTGTPVSFNELYNAVTLRNVNQISPVGDVSGNGSETANPIQVASALNVGVGDMVVVGATSGNALSYTPDAGYTESTDQAGSSSTLATAYRSITTAGTEQPSMTYDAAINRQTITGTVINAA
jgi:hypothetical protein